MAALATFKFLLACLLSISVFPQDGYSGVLDMRPVNYNRPTSVTLSLLLDYPVICHTQPRTTSISTTRLHRSRRHVRFKHRSLPLPFPTMTPPTSTHVEMTPVELFAKSGTTTTSTVHSRSTAATSTTTSSEDDGNTEDLAMLTELGSRTLYSPPGRRPARFVGREGGTKTQITAERKKANEAKKKAAEDKKAASIERKAKAVEQAAAKKQARQDKQVLAAETKAAHALAKAAELRARIAREGTTATAPIKGSAKKIKDSEGSPIFSADLPITPLQSPQRKMNTGNSNKRVSVQSPQRASSPMNESKDSLDDSSDEVLTIGEDTSEEGSDFPCLSPAEKFSRKAVARGGYRYDAPLVHHRSKSPPVYEVNSSSSSQSSGPSDNSSSRTSEDEDDSDEETNSVSPSQEESSKGNERSDSDQESDGTPLIEYDQDNTDRVWPGKHNPKLLSRFVNLHFGGDWHAYIHFGRWAENKRLTTTDDISLDEWLSLKAGDGTEYALTTSMLGVTRSDGGQYHEQTTLAKLSTKTAHSSIVSSPSAADSDNVVPGI